MLRRWFMLAATVFQHIFAQISIFISHKADATTAPAADLDADERTKAKSNMVLTANEAQEMIANRAVVPFEISRLVAYIRAPFAYFKELAVESVAKMIAATGAAMRFVKETLVVSVAKFSAAMGENLRHTKETKSVRNAKLLDAESTTVKIRIGLSAKASMLWKLAQAVFAKHDEEIIVSKAVNAISAPLEMVSIDKADHGRTDATLSEHETSEMKNSAKIGLEVESQLFKSDSTSATFKKENFLSVYARFVSYIRVPVVHLKNIIMANYALAVKSDGVETVGIKTEAVNGYADAVKADATIAKSKANIIKSAVDATTHFAPAEDDFASQTAFVADSVATAELAPTESAFADESGEPDTDASVVLAPAEDANAEAEESATHSVKMATWLDPVVVDGVLILRQAYSATQTENELVVV